VPAQAPDRSAKRFEALVPGLAVEITIVNLLQNNGNTPIAEHPVKRETGSIQPGFFLVQVQDFPPVPTENLPLDIARRLAKIAETCRGTVHLVQFNQLLPEPDAQAARIRAVGLSVAVTVSPAWPRRP